MLVIIFSLCFSEVFFLFFKDVIYLFLGREGEREGEKHQCVVASHMPPLGTWPTTQGCALTRNRTSEPLVCRTVLNPVSRTSQCFMKFFLKTNENVSLS